MEAAGEAGDRREVLGLKKFPLQRPLEQLTSRQRESLQLTLDRAARMRPRPKTEQRIPVLCEEWCPRNDIPKTTIAARAHSFRLLPGYEQSIGPMPRRGARLNHMKAVIFAVWRNPVLWQKKQVLATK